MMIGYKTGVSDKQTRKLSFLLDKGGGTRNRLEPETQGLCAKGISSEETHPFPIQHIVQVACVTLSLTVDGCMLCAG